MTATDPVQTVLDRLDGWKAVGDRQWLAPCPAHDDRNPSLSIGTGDDGRALVKCQAGCSIDDVLAAMDPPMTMADLFPKGTSPNGSATKRTSKRRIVETYDYVDTFGVLLFQVVRYSDKTFPQRRPDDKGGWIWNLEGVERCLYHLPELTRAPDHAMIYIVEGEKDADRLIAEGMFATTTSGGAGKSGLTDLTPLHGRHIRIIPHQDQPGHSHAHDFATQLHGKAASIRIVELPNPTKDGYDVSDYLDDGNDPEDLDRLASQAPEWTPEVGTIVHKAEPEAALATVEPYRDGRESRRAIHAMSDTSQQLRDTSSDLAVQVAEWFDRRGPETLDDIDYPLPYCAAALGVSVSYLHRLRRIGRVRKTCEAVLHTPLRLSERAVLPLARLLDTKPEAIPQALEAANELAKAEAVRNERKKPKPVSHRQTTAAVDSIIGPVVKQVPVTRKPSPNADAMAIEDFRLRVAELADAAAIIGDGIPPDVRTIIHALTRHPWSLK